MENGDSERIEFIGRVAPAHIRDWFMGKMIPEKYRVKGLASPFLYSKKVACEPTAVIAKDTPKKAPACVDCQGREYKTVKIGNQEWMAENLAVTKDRDGKDLVLGKDYFYPGGAEANVKEYGLLYTWEAAMRSGLNWYNIVANIMHWEVMRGILQSPWRPPKDGKVVVEVMPLAMT